MRPIWYVQLLMRSIYFIQHHGHRYSKDAREISATLASDSDSSSDTYTVFGLKAYEISLYWILIYSE